MLNSIRWRLTLLMIALAILPAIAVGAVLTLGAFNANQRQAEDLEDQVALRLSDKIQATITERPRELRLITDIRGLMDLSQPEQETIMSEMLSFDTDFDELALLDATGQEVVRVSRREVIAASALRYRSDAPEFQTPVSTRDTYYSPVRFDQETGEPLMTISLPIVNPRVDQVSYVLVAEYRLRSLWDLFAAQNFAPYDDAFLAAGGAEDAPGAMERVVAHAEPSVVLGGATFDIHTTSRETTGLRGSDVVLAVHSFQLGDNVFAVVAQRTTAEAFRQAYQTLYTIIAGLALIALISGLVGYFVLRQMTRPIVVLADAAEQIGAGNLSTQVDVHSRTELGTLARTFNAMTQQLREVFETLEARVQARTRDLEVAAQVSEQVSTILDPDQLLPQVVELTKANFDLYHAHIYLLDPAGDHLELVAGAGEAGRVMKTQGHRIPINARSLVARAARENAPVIVNAVREDPGFLTNPLLPDTQSEAAVPLSVGDRVLGVLDVQSDQPGHFEADTLVVLSVLARQIAVSLDNARLFSEVARASRHERTMSAITDEIQRATNVDEVLQAATRELGKALGVPRTRIELWLPHHDPGDQPDDGSSPGNMEVGR
jgi:putative methionine-R-sulfoxide reductase with GAF domain